jgi:hypothetical protein
MESEVSIHLMQLNIARDVISMFNQVCYHTKNLFFHIIQLNSCKHC